MKKVFLKYNPYKLETEITVDGKPLADNSRIGELIKSKDHEGNDPRLQDWIEDFPALLVEEYNDRDFEILFHGTLLDYEDVTGAFTDAYHKGLLTAKLERKPAKEISDKEGRIAEVFKEITSENCPFPKLKDAQIKDAFEKAMSDEFEVCVVATMSAGKSTLINAMLGQKLMPSKQEACTAIITKIKDADHNDFCAEVYGKDGSLLETHKKLDYDTMSRLNDDERVSEIRVEGRIPFLAENDASQDKETSLVLIDTPGPNNARNPEHKETQRNTLDKSSKALVLYVMTGEFGTDDDFRVLEQVAKSMAVRGKQSKDRFIFVVNKLDDRKKEDGKTFETLERVRVYLKGHGISNPNLFPAAALPALNIRLMNNPNFDMDADDQDETELKVKKLNRNEELHFEEMAPLPPSVRGKINSRLVKSQKAWTGRENENPEEALIHSGVVSIEAAIRQYVQKYARTAKIKNIVDTFIHRVTELGCEEDAVLAINKSEEERKRIAKDIKTIREKMDSVDAAKHFKGEVDDAVIRAHDESEEAINKIMSKYQARIRGRIDDLRGSELSLREVDDEVDRLTRFAKKLEPSFADDIQELLTDNLINTGNTLIEAYKQKIKSLTNEIPMESVAGFSLDPIKLMSGSIPQNFTAKDLAKEKEVEDGKEWVKNTDRKWYKPWTWFQEKGYYRTKYKTVQFVAADELAQAFFTPIQDSLLDNAVAAKKYAKKGSKEIAERFNREFDRLDSVLKAKLAELESLTGDEKKAKARAEKARENKKWLDDIQNKVESILEI